MSGVVPKYVNMNMRRPAIILYVSHYTTLTVRITLHYTYCTYHTTLHLPYQNLCQVYRKN